MKFMRTKLFMALVMAVVAGGASAQTNKNIPGPTDYPAFSRFVTDRNIFDPNRQPHYYSSTTRTRTPRVRHSASAPAFTFVGTMAYEKGLFAFFSGNDADLKKVLLTSGKIAVYTVTEITPGRAKIESADGKQKLELKVGDVMRQENGAWQLSGSGEIPAGTAVSEASTAMGINAVTSGDSSTTVTPAATGPNDVLKRLMEKRAKENQ